MSSSLNKYLLPIIVLIVAVLLAVSLVKNPPETKRRPASSAPQIKVETKTIQAQNYTVTLQSYGRVAPRTQSALVAQVSGQITYISRNFHPGAFFDKGEVLVKVDARDYVAGVKIAQASLLDAQQKLLEEQAKAEQAALDWQRLGNGDTPSDLVLRKPQLAAAESKVLSAQAQLEKAELALERTQIIAPYAGRILDKKVDLGQVVNNNAQLATIFATDYVEVRLPLKNQELSLIDLPEQYRGQQSPTDQATTHSSVPVTFTSASYDTNQNVQWSGQLVRTEGAIDSQSQQLYVVGQINNPYAAPSDLPAIKIGQYVNAAIQAKTLNDVIVIPNQAIYQGSYVFVVENGLLKRKDVQIRWQNQQDAVISKGLAVGEQLVTTSLGQVSSGTRVAIAGERKKTETPKQTSPVKTNKGAEPSKPQANRSFADLPPHIQARIQAKADEQGKTVEAVMAERRAKMQARGNGE
ncbi:efflux RND transporter periplasmic adaptor subunit [Saccharobesus litoralis]|uniref:Efflux RND transporter periplasmic adaptor subunit n=1 Tax=Saccharobesus litoralis TaxID=2172099 RepID=A0A2S0VT60_9ALTE|nr:efflux RND transporter periplasmic adaptor subunit [Saccharobesus litoralis]AWB67280.1 efflux RND transporter periplasmic adaptor subunit [Saccharobesus litoralis]